MASVPSHGAPSPAWTLLLTVVICTLTLLPTSSAQGPGPDTYANCILVGACTKPSGLKYQCKLVNLGSTPLINPMLHPQFNYQPTSIPDGCLTPNQYYPDNYPLLNTNLASFGASKTFSFCQNLSSLAPNPSFLVPAPQYLPNVVQVTVNPGIPLTLTCKVAGYTTSDISSQPVVQVQCTLFNFNQGLYARNILLYGYPHYGPYAVGGSGINIDMTINGPIAGSARTGSPYMFTANYLIPTNVNIRSDPLQIYLLSAFLSPY